MSAAWNWPGSRWWRVDLHAHSPASHDFGTQPDRDRPDWVRWITAARDAGLHAVAVTDHNTAAAVSDLQHAAQQVDGSPVLFPGVEVTSSDGVHIILLVDPGQSQQHVDDLLSRADISVAKRGDETARSPLSIEQIIAACADDALIIAPHINRPSGLLEHDGQQRIAELGDARLAAVEVDPEVSIDDSWIDGSKPEIGRRIPQVWNSDAHAFDQLGRRCTWVKMTKPDVGGLRLALLDGEDSVQRAVAEGAPDPNTHAAAAIEAVTVRDAKYLGRSRPWPVTFNPWLNAIIGGRGTGKSTLVDFCRAALRRDAELRDHAELRDALQLRLRVPPERGKEGLLTDRTTIELIYRKDGERFALSWSLDGSVIAIERCDGEQRIPEEGDIRERFPVRIYSQKQLFEVARNPNALLAVIDDSAEVKGTHLHRHRDEVAARYMALRAEARALRAEAADLPARRAALADVRRKLNVLQTGSHESVMKTYRKYHRYDGAWQSIQKDIREAVAEIGRMVEDLAVADLEWEETNEDDPATAALRNAHEELGRTVGALQQGLRAAVALAEHQLKGLEGSADVNTWRQAVNASTSHYELVSLNLEAAGIANPAEYRTLLDEAAALKQETVHRTQQDTVAEQREEDAAAVLKEYRSLCVELSRRRERFAALTSSDLVRIEIDAAGQRSYLEEFLRETLGIERFDRDYTELAQRIQPNGGQSWTWEALDTVVDKLRSLVAGVDPRWPVRDRRFLNALQRLQPERLDRLALYLPEDAVTVSFRDQRQPGAPWRPLAQGSPGQQTAALLAFVLGYGDEPIILDQPEDDLDNSFIYELLVRRLREQKLQRQVIVVTHNPNIVVHGDAELVVSLETRCGETHIVCLGGLQERAVRDEICRVMEGGREAFLSRYRRIIPGD